MAAVFNPAETARAALVAAEKNAAKARKDAANADKLSAKAMEKAQEKFNMARSYGCSPAILNAAENDAGQAGINACNTATKYRAEIAAADKVVRDAKEVLRNLLIQQHEHNKAFAAQAQMYEDQLAAMKRTMTAQELHYKSLLKERDDAAKAVGDAAKAAEDAAKAAELAAEIASLQ
jgi:hypothetical protein